MGRKKKILTLINEAAKSEEHKITILPLMCGAGKSSAVSEKIAEAIRKNEGLLVVTDRVKRFNEYLEPKGNEELKKYLTEKKACVSKLKSGTVSVVREQHMNCPVLMMASQRFLRLGDEEIDFYLTWINGRRTTILFDEKPEMYFQYNIDIETLNKFEIVLLYIINNSKLNSESKKEYIREWYMRKNLVALSLLNEEPNNPELNFYSFLGVDIPEDTDDLPPYVSYTECTDPEELEYCIGYNDYIEKETISRDFDQFVKEEYSKTSWRFSDIDILAFMRAMNLKDHNYQLFSYRGAWTGKYESYYSVIQCELPKMLKTASHIVILDGTATLSIDYKQAGLYIDTESCIPYIRHLPRLKLHLVECDTAKHSFTKKNKKILNLFLDYIKKDSKASSVCCFSYKDIMRIEKKEKEDAIDTGAQEDTIEYLGNLKGRNDLQKHSVYGQIGINMCPESYYLSRYIDQHPDQRDQLTKSRCPYMDIESIIKCEEYRKNKYYDLVADIEQNIFRTPIRDPGYKGEVNYYIFYEFSKHPMLKKFLYERFEQYYGATVVEGKDASYILDLGKTMTRKSAKGKGKKTNSQRLLEESDKIAPGTVFKMSEWLKEIGITANQYYSAKKKNKIVRERFDSWVVDKHNGKYKKP